ncbi:MAG: A24 family peptidase [Gammaproteobacteria bacterium]|nr:A24 family peptidase [Gammaproteobacteria bacterium]MCW8922357.1 A24 family peptidase [Gammaproteobacteria bacterium]
MEVFTNIPWLFYAATIALGLCVGSFLNVVIYRLPVMLERDWRIQCHDYLELGDAKIDDKLQHLSLARPGSACPHCGHKIRAWENIPVLSYLFLRGKCSSCNAAISLRYPTIELTTGTLSIIVAMQFGVSLATLCALILTWTLIALTLIDYDKQLLPDDLTLPLLWLGLLLSFFNVFTDTQSSLIGAMLGYMVLWTVFQVFRIVTGKEGMGFGDFKLLAALGAWMGWQLLPQIILLSSLVGAVTGIFMLLTGLTKRQQPIPFGPYLATAGWIALMWGEEINQLYLSSIQ